MIVTVLLVVFTSLCTAGVAGMVWWWLRDRPPAAPSTVWDRETLSEALDRLERRPPTARMPGNGPDQPVT